MRMTPPVTRTAALLVASLLLFVRGASADDVTVMTSGTLTAAYLELLPQLERLIKGKIVTAATSMGLAPTPFRVESSAAKLSTWSYWRMTRSIN